MKTVCLTLRRCPVELHRALKAEAKQHERSLRAQAVAWLQQAAQSQGIRRRPSEADLLQRIRSTRSKVALSAAEVSAAIGEGRP